MKLVSAAWFRITLLRLLAALGEEIKSQPSGISAKDTCELLL